tara:strand:- start:64 stop:690 length:627 start_codon:yes stop_codon:yes gene_type:complete
MTTTDLTHFDSFAQIIANKIEGKKTETSGYIYFLDRLIFIKTIDDIAVDVTLTIAKLNFKKEKSVKVSLEISAKNTILDNGCNACDNYPYYYETFLCSETKESIAIVLKEVVDKIRILKFDRRDCRFRRQETINLSTHLINMFSSIDNVVTNLDKCCVCFEETQAVTSCHHYICIPCADKVQTTGEDDERKCPICRQENITLMPSIYL